MKNKVTMMQWTGDPFPGIFNDVKGFRHWMAEQLNPNNKSIVADVNGIYRICHRGDWIISYGNRYFQELNYLEEYTGTWKPKF